jgi:6-phosphogluconolactonase
MIRIFADHTTLSEMAAEAIISIAQQCLEKHGRFQIVLSGGNTPRETYALLGQRFGDQHRLWQNTHVYWSDERCVPPDDPRSNYRLAKESLLDHVNIPPDQIHRIRGEADDLQAEADCYDVEFPIHPDLILLGMGADGHTASIFPHSPALEEPQRKFIVVQAPVAPTTRITITPPALAGASEIMVLVSGIDKAPAVNQVFGETATPHNTPARLVHDAIWLMDKEAAQKITKKIIVGVQ